MIRRTFPVVLFVATACGGAPPPIAASEETVVDSECCLEDRWEEPPPFIGQTPPDADAPDDALEPFQPDG